MPGNSPWLALEVRDDGQGLAPQHVAGVGLRSMRERAEEIGGRLDLVNLPGGGFVVQTLIPLPMDEG
ncbi:MAG: hypothetical protein AB4911_01065 [Oscillochloridaceae bacterium umkhey_bin13]